MNKSQSLFCLRTALNVSGFTITHLQEHLVGIYILKHYYDARTINIKFNIPMSKHRGHAVAQLIEEGRGFHSRWCNWNFSLT
jgi:hypothetical protein